MYVVLYYPFIQHLHIKLIFVLFLCRCTGHISLECLPIWEVCLWKEFMQHYGCLLCKVQLGRSSHRLSSRHSWTKRLKSNNLSALEVHISYLEQGPDTAVSKPAFVLFCAEPINVFAVHFGMHYTFPHMLAPCA